MTDKVLPKEENLANRVKAYHERYELQDKVLYHIWIPKCKQSKGRMRKQLVVPPKERGKLLVHHHDDVGHPGFQRTLARLQENYFWVAMKNVVARHVKNCRVCTRRKSPKNMKRAPLHPIEVTWPLKIVGVDFVGPLPTTEKGNKYIMTMQDHFTRWPAAYASPEATAKTVVEGVQSFPEILDFLIPSCQIKDRPLCQS